MRRSASRDEYVPQHGDKYEVKGASSRGHGGARIRAAKIAAFAMLALAVIILGVTVKTYASERTAHSDASTVQAENAKVSKSKEVASQALSLRLFEPIFRRRILTTSQREIPFRPSRSRVVWIPFWQMTRSRHSRTPLVRRRSWATWVWCFTTCRVARA